MPESLAFFMYIIFSMCRHVCERLMSWIPLPKEPDRAIHAAIRCSVAAPAAKETDSSTCSVQH